MPEQAGHIGSLFSGLFRRPSEPSSSVDLLADWGIELAPDESVRFWLLGVVLTQQGFLVVTDERFFFLEIPTAQQHRVIFEHGLAGVQQAHPERRGRRLRLTGDDYDELVSGLRVRDTSAVSEFLQSYSPRR